MKLLYTSLLVLFFYCTANATTWPVTVANNTFSPATVNAVVGDIIQFNWLAGIHTTTCGASLPGTSLPAGAAEWNSPINASSTSFSYTVTTVGNYTYGCIPHFAFGMQGNITVSGVLPVKFGTFLVMSVSSKALLQWETFSEESTNYFSIRKSDDGTNFYEIGRLNAAGNSTLKRSYQFTDTDLGSFSKYLYYEIVLVDIDKRESFSVIKTFRNSNISKDALIVALSPNPISRPGQMQLKFNADKAGEMDVSVYNNSGQVVLRTGLAAFYGLNSGHLHVCDLNKGTYNIIFRLAGKKEVKKVIVL